jgi:hypothetical protein
MHLRDSRDGDRDLELHASCKRISVNGPRGPCCCGILPTVVRRFWSSPAATWRLARFSVLALVAFVAVNAFVDAWIAVVVAVVAATLALADDVRSRRAGTDCGSAASA